MNFVRQDGGEAFGSIPEEKFARPKSHFDRQAAARRERERRAEDTRLRRVTGWGDQMGPAPAQDHHKHPQYRPPTPKPKKLSPMTPRSHPHPVPGGYVV